MPPILDHDAMTDTDDLFWNDLLLSIEKGKVIPVLGRIC